MSNVQLNDGHYGHKMVMIKNDVLQLIANNSK